MKKIFPAVFTIFSISAGIIWSFIQIQWNGVGISIFFSSYLLSLPLLLLPGLYYNFFKDNALRLKHISLYCNLLFLTGYFPRIFWLYSIVGSPSYQPGSIFAGFGDALIIIINAFVTLALWIPLNTVSLYLFRKNAEKHENNIP